MKHILAISVGPVQDFIRAARKTRDLWAGSNMLSECARAAAKEIVRMGGLLVFPSDITAQSIPNKIVAELPDDVKKPCAVEEAARQSALRQVKGMAAQAQVRCGSNPSFAVDMFWAQVTAFLEIYAAWHPVDDENDYTAARAGADRLLAGRKALRDFSQPHGGSGKPKSSLDGSRDAVIVLHETVSETRSRSESLDAISAVKRFANTPHFVSTARIAADPWLRSLSSENLEALCSLAGAWTDMHDETDVVRIDTGRFKQFAACPYDTDLLFAADSGDQTLAGQAFREKIKSLNHGQPSPYYAILVADGDKMGELINKLTSVDEHRKLSKALADFADVAGGAVSAHSGATIYAGGDDVMAFLPLDKAISCAFELQKRFGQALGAFREDASLSAGLAIVHFLAPLDRALEWAREAEKSAKKQRASLSVSLHTRTAGAGSLTVVDTWSARPLGQWQNLFGMLGTGAVSQGAIYRLRGLAKEFEGLDAVEERQVLAREVVQCLRHSEKSGGGAVDTDHIEAMMKAIAGCDVSVDAPPPITAQALRRTVDLLIICRHLAGWFDRSKNSQAQAGDEVVQS